MISLFYNLIWRARSKMITAIFANVHADYAAAGERMNTENWSNTKNTANLTWLLQARQLQGQQALNANNVHNHNNAGQQNVKHKPSSYKSYDHSVLFPLCLMSNLSYDHSVLWPLCLMTTLSYDHSEMPNMADFNIDVILEWLFLDKLCWSIRQTKSTSCSVSLHDAQILGNLWKLNADCSCYCW